MVRTLLALACLLSLLGAWPSQAGEVELSAQSLQHSEDGPLMAVEKAVWQKTNELRARHGLAPLHASSPLRQAATMHSEDMLELDFFSHTSPLPGKQRPKDRVRLAHGWDVKVGENIYRSTGVSPAQAAERVMAAWEKSPSHFENMTNPEFNAVGIGVAQRGQQIAVTQVFSQQAVQIHHLQASPRADGLWITLRGQVRLGPSDGGIFLDDRILQAFTADSQGYLDLAFEAPRGSEVSLSSRRSENRYVPVLSFPVEALNSPETK